MKIAIVGASGFIGTRLVEYFYLRRQIQVIPVVRQFASLAVLARFELDCKICDHSDPEAFGDVLKGCDFVIHAALGDPKQIVKMTEAIYLGSQKAGVKRLVVLSTASVHGQNPMPGTNEVSPIHDRHLMAYNNAKVHAEKVLFKLRSKGNTELVILRPPVVYGPRSRFIGAIANQMLYEKVYLINNGMGIFNGLYVDNLIQAIERCLVAENIDTEVFLIGDNETVTWLDLYKLIAGALGYVLDDIEYISSPHFNRISHHRIHDLISSSHVQPILSLIPNRLKRAVKALFVPDEAGYCLNPWSLNEGPKCNPNIEFSLLQQCNWKLPNDKAKRILEYQPLISFEEGMRRTIAWLDFCGYPIQHDSYKLDENKDVVLGEIN